MINEQNINEILNAYLDEELTPRQHNEVKRMLDNDEQLALRLKRLRKTKMLIQSMPAAEAPPELLGEVKNALERQTLFEEKSFETTVEPGKTSLMVRKIISAAAMFALVAALLGVIYTIMVPERGSTVFLTETWQESQEPAQQPVAALSEDKGDIFKGRLELVAVDSFQIDAAFNRAAAKHELLERLDSDHQADQKKYTLTCSPRSMTALLVDMQNVWGELTSAVFHLDTPGADSDQTVRNILPDQLAGIIAQEDIESMSETASYYAAHNDDSGLKPADVSPDMLTAPKPVLTGREDDHHEQPMATLTIVISPTH